MNAKNQTINIKELSESQQQEIKGWWAADEAAHTPGWAMAKITHSKGPEIIHISEQFEMNEYEKDYALVVQHGGTRTAGDGKKLGRPSTGLPKHPLMIRCSADEFQALLSALPRDLSERAKLIQKWAQENAR